MGACFLSFRFWSSIFTHGRLNESLLSLLLCVVFKRIQLCDKHIQGVDVIRGFFLVGLLSPYGLMWNLAGSVFMGCFCLISILVYERIYFHLGACFLRVQFHPYIQRPGRV